MPNGRERALTRTELDALQRAELTYPHVGRTADGRSGSSTQTGQR
jgi:hypothetical protein